MPVDIFTRPQFEAALPIHPETQQPMWVSEGLFEGEYCYRLRFGNPHAEIFLRSSVDASGYSADTGKDSIRAWLVEKDTRKPLAKKLQKWVTRVPGWEGRLRNLLDQMWEQASHIKPCPTCGTLMRLTEPKSGPNAGKACVYCPAKDGEKFLNHYFAPLPGQDEDEKLCPTCQLPMRIVDIKHGDNKGKQALTCPAKDNGGKFLNHHFEIL